MKRKDMDATREEVMDWCIKNKIDFTKPLFPPPNGWLWGDTEVPAKVLTAIFTNTEDADIESVDIIFYLHSKRKKGEQGAGVNRYG